MIRREGGNQIAWPWPLGKLTLFNIFFFFFFFVVNVVVFVEDVVYFYKYLVVSKKYFFLLEKRGKKVLKSCLSEKRIVFETSITSSRMRK